MSQLPTTFNVPFGPVPRVVGTLMSLPKELPPLLCDVAEIRLDCMPDQTDWLQRAQAIEAAGTPVILTVRFHSEGGKWNGPDADRLPLYQTALAHLSAVDIELRSNICHAVAEQARQAGKVCIISYHDFYHTPPLDTLETVVTQAQEMAAIVKIVTLAETPRQETILRQLLAKKWKTPLCVMGMGPLGPVTRISFPALGSFLSYGYLDQPAAPGQIPAAEIVQKLRDTLPAYDEDFRRRKQISG